MLQQSCVPLVEKEYLIVQKKKKKLKRYLSLKTTNALNAAELRAERMVPHSLRGKTTQQP